MTGHLHPRLDILPAAQRALWPRLAPLRELGFVLYGGTAVSLRLGHRVSVDFDFFVETPLDRRRLRAALPLLKACETLQEAPDTLVVTCPPAEGEQTPVKLSLFGDIGFGRVGEPDLTDDRVAFVASPVDLLATKLKVILQRAEAKDYRDIAALIRAGVPLETGLAAARALFGKPFPPAECLRALTWFEDGDLHTLPPEDRVTLERAAAEAGPLPAVHVVSIRLAPER